MERPILVLGAGGHASVIIDILMSQGRKIIGLVDPDVNKHGKEILGVPVLGDDFVVEQYLPENVYLVNGVGSIGSTALRKKLFIKFKKLGYAFVSVVHDGAIVSPNALLSEGVQIFAGAVVQTGVVVRENCIVNTKASVDHDCDIEPHAHVSPGVTLCAEVAIGEGTHVGAGATIIQGVHIGKNSVIGAGSLVLKSQEGNKLIFGVPAKVVDEHR